MRYNFSSGHSIKLGFITKKKNRRERHFQNIKNNIRTNFDDDYDNEFHSNSHIDYDRVEMVYLKVRHWLERRDHTDSDANVRTNDMFVDRFSNNDINNRSPMSNVYESCCNHVEMYSNVFHRNNLKDISNFDVPLEK